MFAEMKVGEAILKGTTEAEQLELIYKLFGTPTGAPNTVIVLLMGVGIVFKCSGSSEHIVSVM